MPSRLNFESIDLRRMPGFPTGGFHLRDLSPGVNIVYGPNGSGKTTLCRALGKVLRPEDPPHRERCIFAILHVDARSWSIEVDHDWVRCQVDGVETERPAWVPPEMQAGYVLGLHDLIGAEDGGELAARIVRESAGGFDLKRIREQLNFRDKPRGKSGLNRDLDHAMAKVSEAMAAQEDLWLQARGLEELRGAREEAGQARLQLERIDKALAREKAGTDLAAARERLNLFPAGIAALRGSEEARLTQLDETLEELKGRLREETARRDEAKAVLDASPLPEAGVELRVVGELRRLCDDFRELGRQVTAREQELVHARNRLESAESRLGPEANGDNIAVLDAPEIDALLDFVRRAEDHRRRREALEQFRAWLAVETEPPGELAALQSGLKLLHLWQAVKVGREAFERRRKVLLAAAVLVGILSGGLAWFVHASWWLLMLGGAALLGWALAPGKENQQMKQIQRDFSALPLEALSEWTDQAVANRLWKMQNQWGRSAVASENQQRWEGMQGEMEQLRQHGAELDRERTQWNHRLGLAEKWLGVETWQLACRLREFQEAADQFHATEATLAEARRQYSLRKESIQRILQSYQLSAADSPEQAAAAIEELARLREDHAAAVATVVGAERILPGIQNEIDKINREATALFSEAGLAEGDRATLRQWLHQKEEYDAAAEEVRKAYVAFQLADNAAEELADLGGLSREELHTRREQTQAMAAQWDRHNRRIIEIETNTQNAKERTDVESALADQQRYLDQLRRQRDEDTESLVGNVLLNHLMQLERGGERSHFYRAAADLFTQITHGRYQLRIDEGDPPAFRGYDTERRVGLELDQLSSATRLQLLLAARMAFVEQHEAQWKLPLIFDETLANSDERRAEAIIEAAIRLCHEGRQIFYLTAQHDEVLKWQSLLRRHGEVPSRLINLAEIRGLRESERVPPWELPAPTATDQVLAPEDDDWLRYGRKLNVPSLNCHESIGAVHLWYLIDDVQTLYRLLRQDVSRWGQLETLVEIGQVDWLAKDSPIMVKISAAAEILQCALDCWQVGRGRPVNRDVLIRSQCVSDTFLDRVSELAESCHGNAQQLLQALENGIVRGFLSKKRHELAEFLKSEGYLDESAMMTPAQILEHVRATAFHHLEQDRIDPARLARLVSFVTEADG